MSNLICSVCGKYYEAPAYALSEFDCDKGYGICPPHKAELDAENETQWVKAENLMVNALNDVNGKKFMAYDKGVRRGLILEAIEDGVLIFEIKRR